MRNYPEQTKYRRSTVFSVKFPTLAGFNAQPRRIDIVQKQYSHDVVTLEFAKTSPQWFETIKTGQPVQITWTQGTLERSWIGYVSGIDKLVTAQRANEMKIHCVSATYPMKQRATRVFMNSSVTSAVEKIVKEFGLNYIGVSHPRKFNQLAMSGHSYWEWIQEQAKRIGYGVIVDGLNFIFKPLDALIDLGFSNAPIMSMTNSGLPANTQFLDRTLDKFVVLNTEHAENATELRMTKTVGGVDPITSRPVIVTTSPGTLGTSVRSSVSDVLFNDYKTDEVANGSSSVGYAAAASAHLARLTLPANIKGQGDPRLRPFGAVVITGTGALTDGVWMVSEVTHSIHQIGDYQVTAKILTDGVGDTQESSFRSRDTSLVGRVNLNQALRNNGKQIQLFSINDVKIRSTTEINNQTNQGFKRTPVTWVMNRSSR